MNNSGYYPAGAANDSNAPYNEIPSEPVKCQVCASVTLSKNTFVYTDDYIKDEIVEWENEDGEMVHVRCIKYDFSDCNLKQDFTNQYYNIPELLEVLKKYVEADLNNSFHTEGKNAHKIFNSLQDWITDDFEVIQE